MIADDEFLVRSSLKSILGEFDTVIDSVDEATNGAEMASMVGLSRSRPSAVRPAAPRSVLDATRLCTG